MNLAPTETDLELERRENIVAEAATRRDYDRRELEQHDWLIGQAQRLLRHGEAGYGLTAFQARELAREIIAFAQKHRAEDLRENRGHDAIYEYARADCKEYFREMVTETKKRKAVREPALLTARI